MTQIEFKKYKNSDWEYTGPEVSGDFCICLICPYDLYTKIMHKYKRLMHSQILEQNGPYDWGYNCRGELVSCTKGETLLIYDYIIMIAEYRLFDPGKLGLVTSRPDKCTVFLDKNIFKTKL